MVYFLFVGGFLAVWLSLFPALSFFGSTRRFVSTARSLGLWVKDVFHLGVRSSCLFGGASPEVEFSICPATLFWSPLKWVYRSQGDWLEAGISNCSL